MHVKVLTANECQLLYLFAIHSTLIIFSFWSVFSYACRECECNCVYCNIDNGSLWIHFSALFNRSFNRRWKKSTIKRKLREKCNFIELTVYCSHIMIFIAYKHVHITTKTLNDTRETIRKLNNASIKKKSSCCASINLILLFEFSIEYVCSLTMVTYFPLQHFDRIPWQTTTTTKKRNGNSLEQTYRKIN